MEATTSTFTARACRSAGTNTGRRGHDLGRRRPRDHALQRHPVLALDRARASALGQDAVSGVVRIDEDADRAANTVFGALGDIHERPASLTSAPEWVDVR